MDFKEHALLEEYEANFPKNSIVERIKLKKFSLKEAVCDKTLLSFMLLNAVKTRKVELIEKLIKQHFMKFYLKISLIWAKIYKSAKIGDDKYRSNALWKSKGEVNIYVVGEKESQEYKDSGLVKAMLNKGKKKEMVQL